MEEEWGWEGKSTEEEKEEEEEAETMPEAEVEVDVEEEEDLKQEENVLKEEEDQIYQINLKGARGSFFNGIVTCTENIILRLSDICWAYSVMHTTEVKTGTCFVVIVHVDMLTDLGIWRELNNIFISL